MSLDDQDPFAPTEYQDNPQPTNTAYDQVPPEGNKQEYPNEPDANQQPPAENQAAPAGPPMPFDEFGARFGNPTDANSAAQMDDQMKYKQDLASGVIHPQTYSGMFADKSTLGKIGTLFGLLASGAGSGMAHQSNAVMDMMNKEIERDLDAQKSNVSNKMNFWNTKFQQQMAYSKYLTEYYKSLPEVAKAGVKLNAITGKSDDIMPSYYNDQKHALFVDPAAKGIMKSSLTDYIRNNTPANNPAGQAALGAIETAGTQQTAQQLDNAQAQSDQMDKQVAATVDPVTQKPSWVDQNKFLQLQKQSAALGGDYDAPYNHATSFKPGIDPETLSQEKNAIINNRNGLDDAYKNFKNIYGTAFGGQAPVFGKIAEMIHIPKEDFEKKRAAAVTSLVKGSGGKISKDEAESLLPGWNNDAADANRALGTLFTTFEKKEREEAPNIYDANDAMKGGLIVPIRPGPQLKEKPPMATVFAADNEKPKKSGAKQSQPESQGGFRGFLHALGIDQIGPGRP